MSQEELVSMISERAGISMQTVFEIINVIGEIWTEELLTNGELALERIGDFYVDHRPGRRGLNMRSREIFIIPPHDFISFTPSDDLMRWSNKLT